MRLVFILLNFVQLFELLAQTDPVKYTKHYTYIALLLMQLVETKTLPDRILNAFKDHAGAPYDAAFFEILLAQEEEEQSALTEEEKVELQRIICALQYDPVHLPSRMYRAVFGVI
jgi:hypothetical protein